MPIISVILPCYNVEKYIDRCLTSITSQSIGVNKSSELTFFVALLHFYVKRLYILEEKLYHYYVNPTSTVLRKGADYHADWLTMQLRKWKTWEERELLTDYRNNKYVEEGLTEFQRLLLQTLCLPIDRHQFEDVMEMVRRHGL